MLAAMAFERRLRIGVPILSGDNWMGGVQYVLHLVTALARLPEPERPEIILVVRPHFIEAIQFHQEILHLVDDVVLWPCDRTDYIRPGVRIVPTIEGLFESVDLLVPGHLMAVPRQPIAAWIPDFQHHHRPELFPPSEIETRNQQFRLMAQHAELMVFSSHASKRDWERFYPGAKPAIRVMPFRSASDPAWFETEPAAVAEKHSLRDPFLICCNQFWSHKGHATLIRALGALRRNGVPLQLVCTGSHDDFWGHGLFEKLQDLMASEGVTKQVHMLGLLPRSEQIALLRRSLAVVQPSQFEGWSTVVEDARLLGKTIVMSDLDVHVEQAPLHGHYFRVDDADDLARKLSQLLPALTVGPQLVDEKAARLAAEERLIDYGRRVLTLAREMPDILAGRAPRSVPGPTPTDAARPAGAPLGSLAGVLSRLRAQSGGTQKPPT